MRILNNPSRPTLGELIEGGYVPADMLADDVRLSTAVCKMIERVQEVERAGGGRLRLYVKRSIGRPLAWAVVTGGATVVKHGHYTNTMREYLEGRADGAFFAKHS